VPNPIDATCAIDSEPSSDYKIRANPFYQFLVPELEIVQPAVYPATTPHDELVALCNRVMLPTPGADVGSPSFVSFSRCLKKLKNRTPKMKTCRISRILDGYSGLLKTRYQKAAQDLLDCPVTRRDAKIKAFIKVEKLTQEAATTKPARVIQGRTPKYNLALMKYLKPVEHWFYQHSTSPHPRGPKTRTVVNGLNLEQRAQLIASKMARFKRPKCISLDAAKFESHCTSATMGAEHSYYRYIFNNDPELSRLLSYQLDNRGVTSSGIKYRVKARRASGDFNTGLGNTLISFLSAESFFMNLQIDYDFVVDGDDLLLIVEEQDCAVIRALPAHYRALGYVMTIEPWETPEQAVHCQARLIKTNPPIMVREPGRTLARAFVSNQYYGDGGKVAEAYFHTIAECEAKLHRGVPVLGPFFESMRDQTTGYAIGKDDHRIKMAAKISVTNLPITLEARISFQEAFGIDPCEQRLLEHYLTDIKVPKFKRPNMEQQW